MLIPGFNVTVCVLAFLRSPYPCKIFLLLTGQRKANEALFDEDERSDSTLFFKEGRFASDLDDVFGACLVLR